MADYTRQVESARRMIRDKGRVVALQASAHGVADPSDPLAGPTNAPAPVTGIPAVFVHPASLQFLGFGTIVSATFKHSIQIAIVASHPDYDFTNFKYLIDFDSSVWKIDTVEKLQPAEQAILYFIGVRRP